MPDHEPPFRGAKPATGRWLMQSPPGPRTRLSGGEYLYFAGTGYLGLQGHPAVIEALREAAARYGVHSATSRTLFGDCEPVREVETRAARLLGAEESLYLVSGYAGNFAIAATLADDVQLALIDEVAHDCLREATAFLTQLAQPPLVFRHRDANHVRELLATHARGGHRALLLTDGVFAISGRLAPIADYLDALARYEGSMLLVDDAHGLATLGKHGRGSLELAGVPAAAINCALDEQVASTLADSPAGSLESGTRVFQSATLSKAIGGHGGVVAGSRPFLDRVRSASGWYRAASAPPAPLAAATAKGLEIVENEPGLRAQLAENVASIRAELRTIGAPVSDDPTPIISLELGGVEIDSADRMAAVQNRLLEAGIAIAYARNYTGAGPAGLLRIAVFATHTPQMIRQFVAALDAAIKASP